MSGHAAATVTLQVWQVPTRHVPAAVAASRITTHRLRRHRDVAFAKVLGTASDAFVPSAATPRRWATLICRRSGHATAEATGWWERHAVEHAALTLLPLSSRGSWDGCHPFEVSASVEPWHGPVVVLTRSTLRLRGARRFYRAVPAIAAELRASAGCRLAFGIGEAPLLRQGTVSIWESAEAMSSFAYGSEHHAAVVAATPREDWYAEQLFTRFALVSATGSIDGTPLA